MYMLTAIDLSLVEKRRKSREIVPAVIQSVNGSGSPNGKRSGFAVRAFSVEAI
jgi:hypothetical protein